MERILLIDDTRSLSIADKYVTEPDSYYAHVVRTYWEGIEALREGNWQILLIDHDLGCFKDGKEYNGYHILCWLEEHPEYIPGRISLVTSNASVWKKMDQLIKRLEALRYQFLRDKA